MLKDGLTRNIRRSQGDVNKQLWTKNPKILQTTLVQNLNVLCWDMDMVAHVILKVNLEKRRRCISHREIQRQFGEVRVKKYDLERSIKCNLCTATR